MLTHDDVQKWIENTLVFLAPAILAFLVTLTGDLESAGAGVFVLYLINVATDLFRKWYRENK